MGLGAVHSWMGRVLLAPTPQGGFWRKEWGRGAQLRWLSSVTVVAIHEGTPVWMPAHLWHPKAG